MINSFNDIKDIIESNKDDLREKYGLIEIGIFGSFVRGETRDDSDVD